MHAVKVKIDEFLCIATVFGNRVFLVDTVVWAARVRNTQYRGGLLARCSSAIADGCVQD